MRHWYSDSGKRYPHGDGDDVNEDMKTNGLEVSLFRDNRDFKINPSKGSALRLKGQRDFGLIDSTNSCTVVDVDYSYSLFGVQT